MPLGGYRKSLEDDYEFNFWPAFADMLLAFVLILMTILVIRFTKIFINYAEIEKWQMELENNIKISSINNKNVKFNRDKKHNTQTITFGTDILFPPDKYELSDKGRDLLLKVIYPIKKYVGEERIVMVQILGHADTQKRKNGTNMELGALRSHSVYEIMSKEISGNSIIDPYSRTVSITSFGEYMPVRRKPMKGNWNKKEIEEENNTEEKRMLNRRIELLLTYRVEKGNTAFNSTN